MADITTDPLTAVYNELWLLLEDSDEFAERVSPGNRIKYTVQNRRDPEKQEVDTADLPEARLIITGIQPHVQRTSNSSSMVAAYEGQIRSGSKSLEEQHFPLVWAFYRAMAPWQARLAALTWNGGERFVVISRPTGEVPQDIERGDVSRGIEGWFAIWRIEVEMFFKTSAL